MSEPILEADAEIYQYVGDEIILTWKMKRGFKEANYIKVFFLIEDQIKKKQDHFLKMYGTMPEFKAGVHDREVIVDQIGELKSEITCSGDILDATARIQSLCNKLGHKLLVLSAILDRLPFGPEFLITNIGPVSLRGKEETLNLFAVNRRYD